MTSTEPPPDSIATEMVLPATDGYALAATRYGPAAPLERVVLVSPATGVKRRIYDAFARFLAARGMGVLTWDWRGIAGSRPSSSLRGFRATMRDWAERDLAGAIDWAAREHPGARLFAVGHSFGGQGIGLAPNAGRLAGMVTVAAQSGWWGHWPRPARYAYAGLWHVAVPLATSLFGYFPAKRLGAGEDLPAGVALEWARWCRSRDYLGDYAGHAALTAPILALSFSDDAFAPWTAVRWLHERYGSTDLTHRHVRPAEVGAREIGHFGFFRPGVAPPLWDEAAEWIAALTSRIRPPGRDRAGVHSPPPVPGAAR
jgi:predicted alpha/beta hydrolase